MRGSAAVAVVGMFLVAAAGGGCSTDAPTGSTTTAAAPLPTPGPMTTTTVLRPTWAEDRPPVLRLRTWEDEISVEPWGWCGSAQSGCHDGSPPEVPPEILGDGDVTVVFPEHDWVFTAELCYGGSAPCMDSSTVELEPVSPGEWRFRLPERGAAWAVTLWGTGANGTLSASFVVLPGGLS